MIRRVLALLVLASLAAPWATFCLPGLPTAMACCAKQQGDRPPVVRACCAATESAPATPRVHSSVTVPAPPAHHAVVAIVTSKLPVAPALRAPLASRTDIRLLNAVFLI